MGIFDRFSAKPAPGSNGSGPGAPSGRDGPPQAVPPAATSPGSVRQRLSAARERLDAKDVPGAVAIYEEVLAATGDRPDVLLTISGDLGSTGHVGPIIELIAPHYDAQRHGPAIGFNLLQAYLAIRNTEAAQHVLDMLFALNRPELEERLFGFSNAIVEAAGQTAAMGGPAPGGGGLPPAATKVSLASFSKPIWFYGLEALGERILPAKAGNLRRVAFAQLAQVGLRTVEEAIQRPEDELGRLSRSLPLWLAESFYFSPHYLPVAVVGYQEMPEGARRPMIFTAEWMTENLRQLIDTNKEGLDYVFTGALRQQDGDYEILLRVWEMKKFRERKLFTARWTPVTAEAELARLQAEVRQFMEWEAYPAGAGLAYAPPAAPLAWLDALGASLGLFLAGQQICPVELLPPLAPTLARLAPQAAANPAASLAWLTLRARAQALGLDPGPAEATLSTDPLVEGGEGNCSASAVGTHASPTRVEAAADAGTQRVKVNAAALSRKGLTRPGAGPQPAAMSMPRRWRTVLGSWNSSARICWKRRAASLRVGWPSYPSVGFRGMRLTCAGRPWSSHGPTARACSGASFFPSISVHS